MHSHSSRVWLFLSLLIVVVLALGACAQPAAPAAPAEAEGGGEEAAAMSDLPADAAAEQVLRINTGSTGSSSFDFYPMRGGSDNQSWMPLLHTPPLYFDVDLNLQPGVFDSWESNDDFTEWVFTIDPRAQFSDGTPITAADFKGTWELMTDPLTEQGRIPGYIGSVVGFDAVREQSTTDMEGLTVVDDSTLQVNLVKADPVFHWRIATTHMNPIKPEPARENLDTFWLPENNPVYSGPYILESFDPDLQEAALVPNPNWWMDEGPYLDRIEFRFQPEPETLAVMLQNDQVDASLGAAPLILKEQFPDYFRPTKNFGFNMYWVNGANEPTSDPNVRKALVHAVDMEAIFKAAYPEGDAIMATQAIDPDLPCLSENSWYEYNPEMAQEALAASEFGSAENLPKLRITPRVLTSIQTGGWRPSWSSGARTWISTMSNSRCDPMGLARTRRRSTSAGTTPSSASPIRPPTCGQRPTAPVPLPAAICCAATTIPRSMPFWTRRLLCLWRIRSAAN